MTASLIDLPAELPAAEQRFRLEGITWQQYDALVALFMDQFPALRMTYLEGVLELMSTSSEHERLKTIIGRLIEAFAEEADEILTATVQQPFARKQQRVDWSQMSATLSAFSTKRLILPLRLC